MRRSSIIWNAKLSCEIDHAWQRLLIWLVHRVEMARFLEKYFSFRGSFFQSGISAATPSKLFVHIFVIRTWQLRLKRTGMFTLIEWYDLAAGHFTILVLLELPVALRWYFTKAAGLRNTNGPYQFDLNTFAEHFDTIQSLCRPEDLIEALFIPQRIAEMELANCTLQQQIDRYENEKVILKLL